MRKIISALLFLSIASPGVWAGCEERLFDYKKTTLDNGLNVITLEDFSCPIVSVQIWYHVGSKNEDPNRQGFAHMFEHMMFRGSHRTGPEEHFSLIRSVGGTVNGYTSFDKTVYLQTLPAEQLELALWLEAERMAFLQINQENFDTERKVVEEELRMKLNEPYGTAWEKLFDGLFDVHPYRWMPIGQISHLRAATIGELRDFWLEYYGPENANIIIVGSVKHEEALELVEKHFSWIDSHSEPDRIKVREPELEQPKTIIIKGERAPAPVAGIGWLTVPASHKDTIALELLASIWGQGKSSMIYRELVNEKRLAVGTEADTYSLEQAGILGAGAALDPSAKDPNQVIEILKAQMHKIRSEGVKKSQLEKARNQMLRDQVTTNLQIENKAKLLGYATIELGDTSRVNTVIDEIKEVTVGDIKRVANKYLTDDKTYIIKVPKNLTGPFFSKHSGQEDSPVSSKTKSASPPPGRGESRRPADYPVTAPFARASGAEIEIETKTRKLDNGLKIIVVPNKEVPFVTVHLGSQYGGWTDDKPGSCSMAMSMLDKGTENYSADRLALELEKRAITLKPSADIDTSSLAASCLTEHVDKTVELMAEVALRPTFPAGEFEKQKQKVLTSLSVEVQTPEYIADKYLRKAVYGKHPYSRTPAGQIEDVNNLNTEICKGWWARYFNRPEDKIFIFAGDIEAEKAFELVKKYFGKWKSTKIALKPKPEVTNENKPSHIYLVDNPKSNQSQIRVGQLGITRKEQPEYFISRIVSDYFGFGFNSRLNKTLRIEKGLTYGVWGGYFAKDISGEFKIHTFSKTESTPDAVTALISEIKKLKTVPPTAEQLSHSKSYIAGSFIRNRETPQQVARDLWLIQSQGLKPNYLDKLLESVKNTTEKDCIKLVKGIEPEKMAIIVVGNAEKLEEPLRQIAPVSVIKDEF